MIGTITMTGEEYDALHAEAEALKEVLYQERLAEDHQRRALEAASENIAGLKAEAEALRAENEAYAKNLRGKHSLAGATYELLIRERDQLRTEMESARGLLRHIHATLSQRDMPYQYEVRDISSRIESVLTMDDQEVQPE